MALPRCLVVLVVLLCTFYSYVEAHAWMSNPLPRGQYTNPKKRVDQEFQPTAGFDPNSPDIVCRSDPAMPQASWPVYTAGQKVDVSISFNAIHPGDCFFYLTYDGDKPDTEKKWFKIYETHDCYTKSVHQVTIPSYLPSAAHAIIRWEWYALHLMDMGRGHVEYFASCTDASIVGFNGGQLPQPLVRIPGHLPVLNDNNYWDPYNGAPQFFTGPPVATLNGVTVPPVSPTPVPTKAPTVTPTSTPTEAPTSRPPTQPTTRPPTQPTTRPPTQPTTRPPTTPAPTQPPATQAPTLPPVATQAPTQPPTQPPAATAAPSNTCTAEQAGHMRCASDETYQTCSHGKWSASQVCPTGLVCAEYNPYIYCVQPVECD